MIVVYLCGGKSKKHYNLRYIQEYQYTLTLENGFWLKRKFQKYTYSCLGCFRDRIQDFPGCSITWKKDWKGDQFFRYSRFSFTVMSKIFLDLCFFFFLGGGAPPPPQHKLLLNMCNILELSGVFLHQIYILPYQKCHSLPIK